MSNGPSTFPSRDDTRPERTGTLVDLRLRKVERVLTFDGTTAHVVADDIADDVAAAVDDQHLGPPRFDTAV
jgi:hypothetical protein